MPAWGKIKDQGLTEPLVEVFMGRRAVESGIHSPALFRDRMAEFSEVYGLKLAPHCQVKICRGSAACAGRDEPCAWCYSVRHDDMRTVGEIMKTVQAGS